LLKNTLQSRDEKKGIAIDENQLLPAEKWLVAFRDFRSMKKPGGAVFLRQFYAPGFYEAFDTVVTFAERQHLDILWFKEKRSCKFQYMNCTFPELESRCTYCNKIFNELEPIPCARETCKGEFCSKCCMLDHSAIKHHP